MSGRKRPRGIFGIPKGKSILFTFQPRDGEECSSDSEDSDYFPGRRSTDEDDEMELIKKAKRKLHKKAKLGKTKSLLPKQTRQNKTEEETSGNQSSESGKKKSGRLRLPPELLLKIFRYGVAMEGIIKFIPRISRVCKEWRQVASDPSLFERLDLSIEQVKLGKKWQDSLLKRDLSQCQHLSLSGQVKLLSNGIESLIDCMPRLVSLDLFSCPNVRPDLIKKIPDICPVLQRMDLSHPTDFNRNFTVPALEAMIRGCGPRLVELRLAGIAVVKQSVQQFIRAIQESCPNLEELDIRTNAGHDARVDMVGLARQCPKLREIRFDGFNFIDETLVQEQYPGLPRLQIYSQAGQKHASSERSTFYKMFSAVEKLTYLNVSSSNLLPGRITEWVKAVDHLFMKDMKWRDLEHGDLIQCLDAWLMSLKTLDLSGNKLRSNILDAALRQYQSSEDSTFQGFPLEVLNLSNSNITAATVLQVVRACKKLKEIDLTSCRELPRGSKRIFHPHEFKSLLKSLAVAAADSDDNGDSGDDDDDSDDDGSDEWHGSDSD